MKTGQYITHKKKWPAGLIKMLMKISQYLEDYFCPGSQPDPRTVRRWIDTGQIPGQKIGGRHFVDISAINDEPTLATTHAQIDLGGLKSDNPLVQRFLKDA